MPGSSPSGAPAGTDAPPTEFGVFPLPGALLLPGGRLPLNVFEPRYRRLVEDALGAGRMFGMIQPDESRPSTPSGPALYRVGCLGRMSSFSETEDGRYLITLTGVCRFAVGAELEPRHGYRRVRGDLARFAADRPAPGDGPDDPTDDAGPVDRARLLAALRGFFTVRGFDANWDTIQAMPDAELVRSLSMICPFEVPEKQALLEAPDAALRSDTLITLLEMGSHGAESEPGTRRAT